MVSVTIVTWNSEQLLEECFAALAAQDYRDLEVIIVDNASTDGTCAVLQTVEPSWRVIYNEKNVGFAAGQNQAIRSSRGEWVLCLNPDVVMSPDFITQLVAAGEAHSDAGSLCGKLLRWNAVGRVEQAFRPASGVNFDNSSGAEVCDLSPRTGLFTRADAGLKARSTDPSSDLVRKPDESSPPSLLYHTIAADPRRTNIIDSTGIYFTRNMRHLDRGAEEIDRGQYDRVQYVFGATGAAALFRRSFIEDVSVEGEFFDEDFFAFREDADLAWRAQLMGWKCLYTPAATAWHVRRVTPERRENLPLAINWHSVKNRFLMRGKNASGWLCWRLFFPVAWRDLMIFGYALLRDRRMWSAVTYPWKVRDKIRRKRAIIQSRRRVSDRDLLWWFSNTPRAIDVEKSPG